MAVGLAMGVGWIVDGLIESRHHPAALADEVDSDDDDRGESEEAKAVKEAATKAALQARAEKKSPLAVASAAAAVAEEIEEDQKASRAAAREHMSLPGILARFIQSRFAEIFVALGVLEWILVWIIREHHDVVSCEVSRLTGVSAETLPRPPRLRFDFGWLKMKAWRALRFILFMVVGTPPAWLLHAIPVAGPALAGAWGAAWTAYWASVFAVANTFLAWEVHTHGDRAPWFVRILRVPGRVLVVGLPFRLYAWVLTRATRRVWPACIAFEEAPWEAAGLAVARLVAGIPLLYLVCRPMFPPAATHALAPRQAPDA